MPTTYKNVTIRGININASGKRCADLRGWVVGSAFAKGGSSDSTYIIENCSSNGNIGRYAGGIVGYRLNYESASTVLVRNCYNTGDQLDSEIYNEIYNAYSGGIVGYFANCGTSSKPCSGTIEISYCYSTGSISERGGGILGGSSQYQYNTPTTTTIIRNCYVATNTMYNAFNTGIIAGLIGVGFIASTLVFGVLLLVLK